MLALVWHESNVHTHRQQRVLFKLGLIPVTPVKKGSMVGTWVSTSLHVASHLYWNRLQAVSIVTMLCFSIQGVQNINSLCWLNEPKSLIIMFQCNQVNIWYTPRGSAVGHLELTGRRSDTVRPGSRLARGDCLSIYLLWAESWGDPPAPVVVPKAPVLRWGWWKFYRVIKKKKKREKSKKKTKTS